MLFNSAAFILLFLAVYAVYWIIPDRWKQYLIIAASFLFYGWFSLPFLALFLFLIVFNYGISLRLLQNRSKKLLWSAILVDLGILAFFKYFYLMADAIGRLVPADVGSHYLIELRSNLLRDYDFEIILPIAISFYTFQIIAWVVDSYRGVINERIPFRKFCVFILFFPQFVAGPIMRFTDFIPQIDHPRAGRDKILNGLLLILGGVVKKVLIADNIGALTSRAWTSPDQYDALVLILLLPAFIVRIYCDFSGYTDIARGLAKLLGYEIPENFKAPFLTRSMAELWQRWHITLSTWLRDYLYIPLGGSRQSEFRTYFNIMLTMSIAGLWHGASWTMLGWGVYMGLILAIERYLGRKNIRLLPNNRFGSAIAIIRTFFLFSLSAALFASPSIQHAETMLRGILSMQGGAPLTGVDTVITLTIFGFLFNFVQRDNRLKEYLNARVGLRYALIIFFTFVVGFLVNVYGDVSGSFIYFAF